MATQETARLMIMFIEWLVGLGRVAGPIAIGIGALLLGVTIHAVSDPLAVVSPSVIGSGALGVIFCLFGAGILFGADRQRSRRLRVRAAGKSSADAIIGATKRGHIPFWVCSDCRVVERGKQSRCVKCGSASAFVQVCDEEDRKLAIAALA